MFPDNDLLYCDFVGTFIYLKQESCLFNLWRLSIYANWEIVCLMYQSIPSLTPGGGHFKLNFVCMGGGGGGGHRIGKLSHLQTKAGSSVNKNTPILRLVTTEID